jgi:Protein of unknown function (DUF3309).
MRFILLLILLLLVIGALPTWPYSTGWGYYPSGLGLILMIVLLVILLRLRSGRRNNRVASKPADRTFLTHTLWRNGLSA